MMIASRKRQKKLMIQRRALSVRIIYSAYREICHSPGPAPPWWCPPVSATYYATENRTRQAGLGATRGSSRAASQGSAGDTGDTGDTGGTGEHPPPHPPRRPVYDPPPPTTHHPHHTTIPTRHCHPTATPPHPPAHHPLPPPTTPTYITRTTSHITGHITTTIRR